MHKSAKDIASCLVHSFDNGIGLRVPAGCGNTCDSQILEQLLKLPAYKFSSIVMHTALWAGISSDP
jgi:hypothetical protein